MNANVLNCTQDIIPLAEALILCADWLCEEIDHTGTTNCRIDLDRTFTESSNIPPHSRTDDPIKTYAPIKEQQKSKTIDSG